MFLSTVLISIENVLSLKDNKLMKILLEVIFYIIFIFNFNFFHIKIALASFINLPVLLLQRFKNIKLTFKIKNWYFYLKQITFFNLVFEAENF